MTTFSAPNQADSKVQLVVPNSAGSAFARVVSYLELLHTALVDDPTFYAALVRRGFLESAIQHTRYTISMVVDEVAVANVIESSVLDVLLCMQEMGTASALHDVKLRTYARVAEDAARELGEQLAIIAHSK